MKVRACVAFLFVTYSNQYATDNSTSFVPNGIDKFYNLAMCLENVINAFQMSKQNIPSDYVITDFDRAALAEFPPVLGSLFAQHPGESVQQTFLQQAQNFYIKKKSDRLFHSIIDLCKYSALSPQTKLLVLKTSQRIIKGDVVDLSDPLLAYDFSREMTQKFTLINKMPDLLQTVCMQDINGYYQKCLLCYIILESYENISLLSEYEISDNIQLTKYINYTCKKLLMRSYKKELSPRTYVRTVKQLHDNIFYNNVEFPQGSYDEVEEIALKKSLVENFPAPLNTLCWRNRTSDESKKLMDFAYLLLNPDTLNILIPRLDPLVIEIEKKRQKNNFYDEIKLLIKAFQFKPNKVKKLTRDFIKTFTTVHSLLVVPQIAVPVISQVNEIDTQYNSLVNAIAVAAGTDKYNAIQAQLDATRTTLHAQTNSKDSELVAKLRKPDFIAAQFQEELPKCAICLMQFAGYFHDEPDDVVVEKELPCKHSLCDTCFSHWNTSCPVCREKI